MATDDYTLGEEARIQTGKTGSTPSDDHLRTLIQRAKREIEGETGLTITDWYGSIQAERALFWLTCVFISGETTGSTSGFAVGDLEVRASTGSSDADPLEKFRARYEQAISELRAGDEDAGNYALGNVTRARDYDFESRSSL